LKTASPSSVFKFKPFLWGVELVECVAAAQVIGQHNVEILRGILGYDESMISELKKGNAISE
jgi:hypothetical protein